MPKKKKPPKINIAARNYQAGVKIIREHPMFDPLMQYVREIRSEGNLCPREGWAVITQNGYLHVNPVRRGEPEEWVYVIAHGLMHLGLGHFDPEQFDKASFDKWNTACDCYIAAFLADMKLGRPPDLSKEIINLPASTEEKLYRLFVEKGVPLSLTGYGTGGVSNVDMLIVPKNKVFGDTKGTIWVERFGRGLAMAVTSAVNVAAGYETRLGVSEKKITPAQRARDWFISSFPLLGALAATFKIIEDPVVCRRMEVSVAAINDSLQEIYINPAAGLGRQECRFVMAHELHAGLRHQNRCRGREPFLWNVACDYVINGWLVEMGLGDLPVSGALYDPELKGLSAEAIYDRIVTDMRRYRKIATLRGVGLGDMLEGSAGAGDESGQGVTLDEFYRNSLSQGLVYHEEQGRGYLPAGLVEEIRALSQPAIPWDVELAQWFDNYFAPLEKVRSFARPSRRQSSTPDIPRPRWVPKAGSEEGRTYGVILDTSGSMNRSLLAKALGAIASYSISRDVPFVRVVFCDAVTYDQGYLACEDIAGSVKIKGRGGTVLQPGVDLLEKAEDFPKKGPLLIITDGFCDNLKIHRDHAYIIPKGRNLPFIPRGKVFRLS